MLKLALLSFLTITLLRPISLFASQSAVVSNASPNVRIKEVQLGEKKERLKAELNADRGLLQIRRDEKSAVSSTNDVLAQVEVTTVGPCGFDFAMTSNGALMWVFVQQMSVASRQHVCLFYPLARENDGNYVRRMRKVEAGGKQHDVPISFDLTAFLRNMAVASFQRGKPLALGREARISGVQLESTNAALVVVTGNLGANYCFRGTVMLGANNEVLARDFTIEPTRQNTARDPK